MSERRARLVSGAAALAACVSLWASLAAFRGPEAGHRAGWKLYWTSVALAVVAAWPWRRPAATPRATTRREWVLFALVVVAGAAFRLYRLADAPYGVWFDEAQNGIEAMRILADPAYRPVFVPGISQLPALAFYYFALFVDAMGPHVLALRLATTLIGLVSIVVVWALGRELFGPRVGLIAAALLALSRWHVTFSRFAVSNLAVTLFLPLALLLFVRALDRRCPLHAVLCGVALGLGLQSYYAMLAAPVVLAALFGLGWLRGDSRGAAPAALAALALAVGACAYAPVLQYARAHPQEYGQRVSATTFVPGASPARAVATLVRPSLRRAEAWAALRANLKAHAIMFHVRGDSNGRHNLPGAPMLDPVSGAFFAIGLLMSLARPLAPRHAALLLPFGAMMAAGVLSLTFEAPQAARTLGATPFVALMGALPLAALSRWLQSRAGPPAALAAVGLLLAAGGAWSARVFDRQLRDPSAWESYSTQETRIADEVRAHGHDADVYVPETLAGGPTITFRLGQPLRAAVFDRARDLPLPSRGRSALLFLQGSEAETAALVRVLYPQASVTPFGAPLGAGGMAAPVLWTARIPAEAIAGLQGWDVTLERAGRAVHASHTHASEWDWSQAEPPFLARIRGTLRSSEDAPVVFEVHGPRSVLAIDDEVVLNGPARTAPVRLARGLHEIALTVPVAVRGQRTSLLWSRDGGPAVPLTADAMFSAQVPAGGLLGAYHSGPDLQGEPSLRRVDPQVAFYFHLLPVPRPFSVRWTGSVYAETEGRYAFGTASIDSSSVVVDGVTVLANDKPSEYAEGEVELDPGWHDLEVRYRAESNYSQVVLQWATPDGRREPIPATVLRPPGPSGRLRPRSAPAPRLPVPRVAASEPKPPPGPDDGPSLSAAASRTMPLGEGLRIAAGRGGLVYVLDPGQKRLLQMRASGDPTPLPAPSQGWVDPSDLAVDSDGRLLVLDAGGFVAVYEAARPTLTLDLRPLGVYNPRGLAASAREILVADTGGGRVLILDRAGRMQATVGRRGNGPGELTDPVDVARDAEGGLVVVDAGNGRILRFRRDGQVDAWPRSGDRQGLTAERLDVGSDGAVWVAGGGAREVWRLAPGAGPRRHALTDEVEPEGLAVGDGRLWLTAARPSRLLEVRLP